ncbi:hypothetical protein [Cellulomonas rhizosphaerae]|uniref:Uncharacterized protein n=1 Tax=Cellulomonas rhizosphaerae TaxID=2293719 RepID=A0A413RPU3_9CELL|nr:hypothetical protein [Cellulomonas rhizosphaerae]RHA43931.1 hypothetical protein D1825_03830 [Cellulomonas rhizosphaerae]
MHGTAQVHTSYHLIWLADATTETDGERDLAHADLLGSYEDESAVMVWPGIHTGTIEFTWDVHDEEPPMDRAGWDDVAEAVVALPSGELAVRGFSHDEVLLKHLPGRYAVRCWARGRDLEYDGSVLGIAQETFHLDLWIVEQLPRWVAPAPLTRAEQTELMYRESMQMAAAQEEWEQYEEPPNEYAPAEGAEPEHPLLRAVYRLGVERHLPISWWPAGGLWDDEGVIVEPSGGAHAGADGALYWTHEDGPRPVPPGSAEETLAFLEELARG